MRNLFLILMFFSLNVFAGGKFTNSDFKSLAEIQAVSPTATAKSLLNDNKVYISSLNKQLSSAIADGSIFGNATALNVNENFIANPYFETSVSATWTTSSTNVASGAYAFPTSANRYFSLITSTNAGGYFRSAVASAPSFAASGTLELAYNYRAVSGTWTAAIWYNGSAVATQTIVSGAVFSTADPLYYNLSDTTGAQVYVQFTAAASAAVLALDNVSFSRAMRGRMYAPTAQGVVGTPVTYWAYITSGNVVTELYGVDWINGNCSGSNQTTCNINSGYFSAPPFCLVNALGAGGRISGMNSLPTTSQFVTNTDPGTYDKFVSCSGLR